MKMKMTFAGIAAALMFGAGAVVAAAGADFGSAPVSYESEVEAYFASRLTDPRRARFHYASDPYPVYADVSGYENLPCWAVDVRVKSRLPSGGYGGYVPYTVIMLDGEPIALRSDVPRMVMASR